MASSRKKSATRRGSKSATKPARKARKRGTAVAAARAKGGKPVQAVKVRAAGQLAVAAAAPKPPKKPKGGKRGKGKKGPKSRNPVKFTVVLANGRVRCEPANGNRLVRRGENRDISWNASSPTLQFELVFRRVDFDGAGTGTSDWPFDSPQPGGQGASTGVVSYFEGTLRADPDAWTAYKYDVHAYANGVKVATLDPMIIIGKL